LNENSIKAITDEIAILLMRKNKDYGAASFDLGLNGNMVHLWDKVKRYRNLVEKGSAPSYESIADTLRDIIGYAIIGLHILNDDGVGNKFYGNE
jgi:hypothetical protein